MLIAWLILTAAADGIPAIYKSSPYFSNAIGSGTLTVTASADSPTLIIGESLVFTINVENVRNPADVKRPMIETTAFAIENLDTKVETNRVAFRYRLKPRATDVTEIPSVRFDYYFPEAAEDKRLRTKYTDAIPIVVKAKVEGSATPRFTVPERFQTLMKDPGPSGWMFPIVMIEYAIVCFILLIWVIVWRNRNPQGVRLARLQRHRAVRRAIASLNRGEPQSAFRNYLHERFELNEAAATPAEFSNALRGRKLPDETVALTERVLRDGDAARFGGIADANLADRTREAILALEAAI